MNWQQVVPFIDRSSDTSRIGLSIAGGRILEGDPAVVLLLGRGQRTTCVGIAAATGDY
jgi:hypothetical protein